MTGIKLSVLPKRALDFATLANPSTQEVILADRIELFRWRELLVKVRVHLHTLTAPNIITIFVYAQSWTDEEPGLQFVASTAAASVAIQSTTPSPGELDLVVPTLATNGIAGMARITAIGNRGGGGTMQAQLSMEVIGKAA